jgi:hypothetical protein
MRRRNEDNGVKKRRVLMNKTVLFNELGTNQIIERG